MTREVLKKKCERSRWKKRYIHCFENLLLILKKSRELDIVILENFEENRKDIKRF